MRIPRFPSVKIKGFFEEIKNFAGGSNFLTNERRVEKNSAIESVNLIQAQDGVWKTRPGVDYYGAELPASIDGAVDFVYEGNTELLAVSDGKLWKSVDAGAWSEVSGATWTAGIPCFFVQIGGKLYIANGTDPLAFYDGSSLATFAALANPAAPSGARTGLSAASFANYYRIVAINEVGFTNPSASTNVTTNKDRNLWSPSTEYITLTWAAVAGATGYQIFWGNADGAENFIGSTTNTTFVDDGTLEPNPFIEAPDDNTTGAPLFTSMEVSNNRVWATGDPANPYRVYWSGTGRDLFRFSPFYGGGYIDLERGGRSVPVAVSHYRDGRGTPMITVFCSSLEGFGTTFQIEFGTAQIGDVVITLPFSFKITGSVGADAPRAVVKALDNVIFLNKKGIYALRAREQIFNVLATDDIIPQVRSAYRALNHRNIKNYVGYFSPPALYLSVSEGESNDRTIIFDFERNNWNWGWSIGFNGFLEYTSTTGRTRLLGVPVTGNKLVEISENFIGDFGAPFYQSYISPLIPVSGDYTDTAKIKDVVFEFGNLRGTVTCEVLGLQRNKQVSSIATKEFSASGGTTGISDELFSEILFSDTVGTPKSFAESTTRKRIRVGKRFYAVQFKVYATGSASFELLGIQAKGFTVPGRVPSDWN